MKKEILKNDSVSNVLIGDRVIIKLDEALDHTVTDSGLMIPLTELRPTESGDRMKAETSDRTHLTIGTIVQVGTVASQRLEELKAPLSEGDRVYVSPHALGKAYHYQTNRNVLVQTFDGTICIPHTLIEVKL